MRAFIQQDILYICSEDLPSYKKGGSIVRNSYFWALKSIAGSARFDQDWQFEQEVWFALNRMLLSFAGSGYLGVSETLLEFEPQAAIPDSLRSASTWR
ncbi:MAG: hypothetical protein ACO31I_05900 [Prochlorotrichaceae cyanobacterium]|jgi:hypothetical protein